MAPFLQCWYNGAVPKPYPPRKVSLVSTPSVNAALRRDAYDFVSSKMGGTDMSSVPFEAIRGAVDHLYEGGWVAYERDFRRATTTAESYSPIKQKAIVEAMTKIRLREYDSIIKFDFDPDDHATFVVSKATTIDRRARRDIVTERELTLFKFTRSDGKWLLESISITEAVNEIYHRFGSVNTVARHADKKDQFENCYRPGTSRSPLAGWVARLELSWDQAHANEVFPSTTTTA